MIHLFCTLVSQYEQASKQARKLITKALFFCFVLSFFWGAVEVFNAVKFFHQHHPEKVLQFLQQ
jgi:hypothetical protein